MKLGERVFDEDGKMIVQRTFDPNPTLKQVDVLKQADRQPVSDSKHIGRVPLYQLNEWLKEAGVSWDDTDAVSEVLRKKLLDGDNSKFRVWEGRF